VAAPKPERSKALIFSETDASAPEPSAFFGRIAIPETSIDPALLTDPALSLKNRLRLARQIGEKGDPASWRSALSAMLPASVREALLESIGASGRPEASEFLRGYLGDAEQGMRRAAARGLAATGRPEDAQFLGEWMGRPGLAIEESTEVALALGGSRAPNATAILLQAYPRAEQPELGQCLILGLAQRPIAQTQGFFRQMLGDPATEPDRKKEALQALGQFDSVREDFFLPYLQNADPEVRRGAYLGLGVLTEGNPGPRLLQSLSVEKDPQARLALLESLGMQPSGDPWALNRIALAETEPLTRIVAAKAVARSLQGRGPTDAAVQEFGRMWAPELARLAVEGSNTEGLQAVSALAIRRNSPEAQQALRRIAAQAEDTKVKAAAERALRGMKKTQSGFGKSGESEAVNPANPEN
jgi:HEAT repeat protein